MISLLVFELCTFVHNCAQKLGAIEIQRVLMGLWYTNLNQSHPLAKQRFETIITERNNIAGWSSPVAREAHNRLIHTHLSACLNTLNTGIFSHGADVLTDLFLCTVHNFLNSKHLSCRLPLVYSGFRAFTRVQI